MSIKNYHYCITAYNHHNQEIAIDGLLSWSFDKDDYVSLKQKIIDANLEIISSSYPSDGSEWTLRSLSIV